MGRPSRAGHGSFSGLSVSAIARTAGVDRTFFYRHPDLLTQVHLAQARPAAAEDGGPVASRASLQADLANAQGQITRQAARVRQLEAKLSQLLGEQAWRESGLDAPEDIDKLKRRTTELEQQVVDLTRQLEERGEELDAARAANREMIAQMNTVPAESRPPLADRRPGPAIGGLAVRVTPGWSTSELAGRRAPPLALSPRER